MPSLKLSNPFRRAADRPSLKQRAASLRATAARVIGRKPADPILPLIDRYRASVAAEDALSARIKKEGWDFVGGFDAGLREEDRLSLISSRHRAEVLATVPATEAGRLALADFIAAWVADHGNANGSPQDGSEIVFAEVYPALLKALRASDTGQAV